MKTINILGTQYKLEIKKISEDKLLKDNHWAGYCSEDGKLIVIADMDESEYFDFENEEEKDKYTKRTIRHEIVHAFLNESGLSDNAFHYESAWAKNEEMVDWFAIQFPKIYEIYKELNVLD